MKMPAATLATAIYVLAASTALGEIVGAITPSQVKEAIAFGTNAKKVQLYRLSSHMGRVTCGFSTPFLRIAMAAREAKKNYKPFTETDANGAFAGPFVEIACPSTFVGGSGPEAKRIFANVQNVVITGKGGSSDAVQPTKTEAMPETYQNAFGLKIEASGLLATFPVEAFKKPGAEIHVIYDKKVKAGFSGCDDCTIEIRIAKDVR